MPSPAVATTLLLALAAAGGASRNGGFIYHEKNKHWNFFDTLNNLLGDIHEDLCGLDNPKRVWDQFTSRLVEWSIM